MALFKRGKVWSYDFQFLGQRRQGSTHHTNKEEAAKWLRAYRTRLANGLVGLDTQILTPPLKDFLDGPFDEHLQQQHRERQRTYYSYKKRIGRLKTYKPLMEIHLSDIGELDIQGYKQFRQKQGKSVATINNELRVLRMALLFAQKCKLIRYGGVSTLPGERSRMFIVSGELEKQYLSAAQWPLKQVAILMLDLGLRPEEAVSLRKADVADANVTIAQGKTVNARRSLPQTERTREVFALCNALFPDSEWCFPGRKPGTHLTRNRVSMAHVELRTRFNDAAAVKNLAAATSVIGHQMSTSAAVFPADFLLYSLRHSFGTRLAESGASVWEIKKRMGHSSVTVSEKYIHITDDHSRLTQKRFEEYGRILRGEPIHESPPTPESVDRSR